MTRRTAWLSIPTALRRHRLPMTSCRTRRDPSTRPASSPATRMYPEDTTPSRTSKASARKESQKVAALETRAGSRRTEKTLLLTVGGVEVIIEIACRWGLFWEPVLSWCGWPAPRLSLAVLVSSFSFSSLAILFVSLSLSPSAPTCWLCCLCCPL